MAENTKNLGLKKPSQEDFYNVNDFNNNFQKIDDFVGRKDNPHDVTAQQVGSLKIYYSFATLNAELNTSFDVTTPISDIISALPDNTGLKADICASDTTIYPTIYGILTIYKIRENRGEIEYVSNVASAHSDYNKRWVGQYNDGVFGGFLQVFTENNPPSALDITRGVLKIQCGGTGAKTAAEALAALGGISTSDKPTGTYTGNGSSDTRTISVGGTGNVLCIYGGSKGMAIVTPLGCFDGASSSPAVRFQWQTYGAWFENGVLTLKSNDVSLNDTNYTYTYQVL